MNRREFLQSSAATAAAAGSGAWSLGRRAGCGGARTGAWPENGTLIPDEGWRLWVDRAAEWKQDAIYLPEDVTQDATAWCAARASRCR